jgi:xylulokinase
VTRDVLQAAGVDSNTVVAIGVCGFMHTPVGVDETGSVVAPVIVWNDPRGELQADALRRQAGDRFREVTGDTPRHNHTVAKLRFLQEHFPEASGRVSTWLLPKDYLRLRLTGKRGTDVSDALGTLLYDPTRDDWDPSLVELAGVRLETLPPVGDSTEVSGTLGSTAAEALSLRPGIPVATGSADGYATLLGCNGSESGRTCLYLGTSAWITHFVADPGCDPRKKIAPAPGGYHVWVGAISCAGGSLSWLRTLLGADRIDELITEAEESGEGARGLVFLPHLAGERGPTYNPNARGSWIGLTLDHRRGDLARAVLEGVAFQLRRVLTATDAGQAIVDACLVGGGAASGAWGQLISDVTGLTLEVPEVIEASALGAAICAGVSVGVLEDVRSASQLLIRMARKHSPDPLRAARYQRAYDAYVRIDDVLAFERAPLQA